VITDASAGAVFISLPLTVLTGISSRDQSDRGDPGGFFQSIPGVVEVKPFPAISGYRVSRSWKAG
jgi:hypothetical protein